jgi:hypothetical protein
VRKLLAREEELRGKPMSGPLFDAAKQAWQEAVGVGVVPDGHQRYQAFYDQFQPQYLALPADKQAGALNLSDPNSLASQIMSQPGIRATPEELRQGYLGKLTHHLLEGPGIPKKPPAPSGYEDIPADMPWDEVKKRYGGKKGWIWYPNGQQFTGTVPMPDEKP